MLAVMKAEKHRRPHVFHVHPRVEQSVGASAIYTENTLQDSFDLVVMWQHATHGARHGVALYAPASNWRAHEKRTGSCARNICIANAKGTKGLFLLAAFLYYPTAISFPLHSLCPKFNVRSKDAKLFCLLCCVDNKNYKLLT